MALKKLSSAQGLVIVAGVVVSEDIVVDLLNGGERNADVAVCAAVVQSDTTGISVLESSAGEADILDEASFLVPGLRREQVERAAVEDSGRLVDIQDSAADAIDVSVAGIADTVVENEPALVSLDRCSAAADLQAFPPV